MPTRQDKGMAWLPNSFNYLFFSRIIYQTEKLTSPNKKNVNLPVKQSETTLSNIPMNLSTQNTKVSILKGRHLVSII